VLDESGGTGSGWDTAYVTGVSELGIDKALKISLEQEDNTLKPSSPSGALGCIRDLWVVPKEEIPLYI